MAESVVRISIADVPQVRDAIDQAAETIRTLQEALITERLAWQPGPGMMTDAQYAEARVRTREELRAEGLPMGALVRTGQGGG